MSRKPRSVEEQAALDAALESSLAVVANERARRQRQEEDFLRPQFARRATAEALGVADFSFQNWQARHQLDLDADVSRIGTAWRLYSPRDVVRLGIAVHLSRTGFPASMMAKAIRRIDESFPLSARNPFLAANVPVSFAVMPDGEIFGPFVREPILPEDVVVPAYTILRLDIVIRSSLERLGMTMTNGNASDHRAAIERLVAPKGGE